MSNRFNPNRCTIISALVEVLENLPLYYWDHETLQEVCRGAILNLKQNPEWTQLERAVSLVAMTHHIIEEDGFILNLFLK